ncbi:MAG: carboxypeptidase-like regulatory domain-containing protein [bacterium]|nr:carboxypeptidase-like regulatory domain-containing protein [bacterium]
MLRQTLACAALALFVGCGSSNPPTAQVTGTVTLDGNPVEGATVLFIPDDASNKAATASTQADGTYALTTFEAGDGAMPGSYKVKVHKFDLPEGGHNPYGESPTAEDVKPMTQEEELAAMEAAYSAAAAKPSQKEEKAKNALPQKYADQNTSGLSYTVTDSGGTYDIALTSK